MTTAQETRTGTYEAMFLVPQSAASNFAELIEHINHLFERASATVIAMKKWDERRLAFEIDKQKRGVYILAYFTCPTDMLGQLERDATISERIMRLMVVKADHLTDEEIAACDDRQGLSDEAKLRADRGDDDQRAAGGARLGAPEKKQPRPDAAEAQPTADAGAPTDTAPPTSAPDAGPASDPDSDEPKPGGPGGAAPADDR